MLEGLVSHVFVQLCDPDIALICKQAETIQQLLVSDENEVGCDERAEKIGSAGRGSSRVVERGRKSRASMKSLGILQVASGDVSVQHGKLGGCAYGCSRTGGKWVIHRNRPLVHAES